MMSEEQLIASSLMFGFSFTLLIAWVLDEDRSRDKNRRDVFDWIGRMEDGETLTAENMFGDS